MHATSRARVRRIGMAQLISRLPLRRFQYGLGMSLVALSDLSTGNCMCASYALHSNDVVFTFTAPYSRTAWQYSPPTKTPIPNYNQQQAHDFIMRHGLAVRAVGEWPH